MKAIIKTVFICTLFAGCKEIGQERCLTKTIQLKSEVVLPYSDSLGYRGGIVHVNPKDSLCKDTNVYTEIIADIWDANVKKVIRYRVLDNKTNWVCMMEMVKCNHYYSMTSATFTDIDSIGEVKSIRIAKNGPYSSTPYKTVKATVQLESENDFGATNPANCINCYR